MSGETPNVTATERAEGADSLASPETATDQSPEEIQARIEVQRQRLAGTLDALSAKLDVKGHAQARVAGTKATAQAKLTDARAKLTDARTAVVARSTTDSGGPRPELLVFAASAVVAAVGIVWWRSR